MKLLFNPFKRESKKTQPISENRSEGLHPIFSRFPELKIELEPGETYYEWIDVLEAMDRSEQPFVMVEVGAGRGARGQIAAQAAKTRNIPVSFFFVEGEPYRAYEQIPENMENEGVSKSCFKVFPFCLGTDEKEVVYYFSGNAHDLRLDNWLGQRKILEIDFIKEWTSKTHMGLKVGLTESGYEAVMVPQKKFSSILDEVDPPIIDLCDFDIQGSEYEVIKESIDQINQRVKRLHIGTHSLEIEKNLLKFLKNNGWELVRYYPGQEEVKTDFGTAHFVDGVQTWVNPRFSEK